MILNSAHPNAFGYERMISGISNMPRMAEPEEIAAAALFLVSDDASYVNGEVWLPTADGRLINKPSSHYIFFIKNSVLRFMALPSSVLLSPTGFDSP